jgi:hypothetical protein
MQRNNRRHPDAAYDTEAHESYRSEQGLDSQRDKHGRASQRAVLSELHGYRPRA